MARIFLTHPEGARTQYYAAEALARLQELGEVRLNETDRSLTPERLTELASGCQVIVSDAPPPLRPRCSGSLPDLVAFVRCAVDIRNVDVGAASAQGVLVTRASPGSSTRSPSSWSA